ncbi:hypothetical protein ALP50_05788 [Pseudomonas syringae pv. spinaceae]|nr:hypothetical protein ALP50_05788 [Pseudomonas syringae pv. spinaceae]
MRQFAESLHRLNALIEIKRRGGLQGTHREVHGHFDAFVFVTRTQTVENELQHLLSQARGLDLGTELRDRELHGLDQVQVQLLLDQDPQDAQSRTTQGIRVFAAGGQHADTENTDQRVQLVSDGNRRTRQRGRQFSTCATWHVLLVERQRDIFCLAIGLGVIVTGDALHFRELANHFTRQVALGQQTGTRRTLGVAADAGCDVGGKLRDALGLVEYAAQLGLEHDVFQAIVEGFQLLFLVLLEEELGVGQAWTNHFLVTGDDLGRVLALDVGHRDEARQQLAVGIQQAEILLVVLHGGDQGFLRHIKETLFERAHQRHRPFDQPGHFVQQAWRHDGSAFLLAGQLFDALADDLPTFVEVGQYVSRAQVAEVAGRRRNTHVFRVMEAVAARMTTGALGENRAVSHLIAEQHHQPLGRPYELFLASAPAHALGNRQVVQRVFDNGRQQRGGRLAENGLAVAQFRAALIDFAQVDAALLGEAQSCLSRVAVSVERGLTRRAVQVHAAIRLLRGQCGDQHGQATRRGVDLFGAIGQTCARKAFFNTGEKSICQRHEGLGWQFFGAQFNQKILSTHCAASSLANTSSRRSGGAIGKPRRARACR